MLCPPKPQTHNPENINSSVVSPAPLVPHISGGSLRLHLDKQYIDNIPVMKKGAHEPSPD